MKKVVSFLRDSNISKYTNIMSSEDVIKSLLQSQAAKEAAKTTFADESIKDNDELIKILADVFQSLTTKAMTTREIIEYIYDNYNPESGENVNRELGDALGDSIKIVHAKNYKLKTKNKDITSLRQALPFVLIKEQPEAEPAQKVKNKKRNNVFKEVPYYKHMLNDEDKDDLNSGAAYLPPARFGLTQLIKSPPDSRGNVKLDFAKKTDTNDEIQQFEIFNCEEMINAKVERTDSITGNISEKTYFNALDINGDLIENKDNTSVSVVMLNNPNIRAGTKNSLELSTFLNILSTIELSKCQPYFNATFILPDAMQNLTGRIFKTASITQFLEGSIEVPWDNAVSDLYNTLEASFVREINRKKDEQFVESTGTTTNMSAFTMPQTVNNFDEVYVGHDDVLQLNEGRLFKRANQIHDITRPFMTIKSFNVDVSPTQGLMSFKTGKLSLILHDRTRMVDIAPFIKPDLFGSFGAEISIEYGWSHIDAQKFDEELKEQGVNHIAEFLDKTRVIEKYIITNSSFKIVGNGQVDIDLSIAMRGPVDIRTVFLDIDSPKKIAHDNIRKKSTSFSENKNKHFEKMQGTMKENPAIAFSNTPYKTLLADTMTITDTANFDSATTKKIRSFKIHLNKFKTKLLSYMARAGGPRNKAFKAFANDLNAMWRESGKEFNQKYLSSQDDIFFVMNDGPGKGSTFIESGGGPKEASILGSDQMRYIKSVLIEGDNSYEKLVSTVSSSINGNIGARRKKQNSLVKQLIGGVGEVDPFYDKDWLKQYYLFSQEMYKKTQHHSFVKENKLPIYGIKPYNTRSRTSGETSYVSFGCIVTAIITSHLSCIGKFDEIQIVSYTANSYCGLMSNRNIMSFLIDREELTDFLFQLFSKEAKYTIEAIMTQICQRFISTRDQICYGIKSLYSRDGDKSISPVNKNVKQHQQSVNQALKRIYESRTDKSSDSSNTSKLDNVVFLMPKIKFSFDTLTTKESGYLKTISRISIFDQQDNPFGSVKEIMEKVYDENIILAAAEINRLRSEMFSKKDQEAKKSGKRSSTVNAFYAKANAIVQDLINKEIIIKEGNTFRIAGSFKTNSLKQEFKRIMPSATYGTQNNTLLDASISTINEANLNTVYLTRPDRNSPDSLAKISFGNDLPLRILPAQADITMYGCPFINFAQYIFLDFETGTTVDNTYAVTGIKHDMTPGKFTTSLTLSYGDVYGKYENAVGTISEIIANDTPRSSVRFFGGNIRVDGVDGTTLPDDLSDLDFVEEKNFRGDNIVFTNNSIAADRTTYFKRDDEYKQVMLNKYGDTFDKEFVDRLAGFFLPLIESPIEMKIKTFKVNVQSYSYKENKAFATVKTEEDHISLNVYAAIDFKTTYNKNIYYKLPIEHKEIRLFIEDFFSSTDLINQKRLFEIINKNIIKEKYDEKGNYIIKDVLDIIKLKFSVRDDSFNKPGGKPDIYDIFRLINFYYSFKLKPLTSGTVEFEEDKSQIFLDGPNDYSIFKILSDDDRSNKYFFNDISVELSRKGQLCYNSVNNKVTSIKILLNKKSESKLPIQIKYNTKVKKKTKEKTEILYFYKDDDGKLSREFQNQILQILNEKIFNYKISTS